LVEWLKVKTLSSTQVLKKKRKEKDRCGSTHLLSQRSRGQPYIASSRLPWTISKTLSQKQRMRETERQRECTLKWSWGRGDWDNRGSQNTKQPVTLFR
jgi:hypothetical protein